MGHGHHHHHHHHHGDPAKRGERSLWWAAGANMLLTLAQIAGGIISGSLSLIADALHNFSDAASLLIALVAIRIGRKPPDQLKTFGYKRAETVAALINLTALAIIGVYLAAEAIKRFYAPQPIEGWLVIAVAGLGLLVNISTAALTFAQSRHSMNIRAAFLHNLSDAASSVGVIISGTLVLLYGWVWTDAAITLLIAAYVFWQCYAEMPTVIHLLMEGTPHDIEIDRVIAAMQEVEGVDEVHHVHIWQLDERRNALEAHVVVTRTERLDDIKKAVKLLLEERYAIVHSTLEMEAYSCEASAGC